MDPAVCSGSTLFVIETFLNMSAEEKADDFCCDWRFKGYHSSCAPVLLVFVDNFVDDENKK